MNDINVTQNHESTGWFWRFFGPAMISLLTVLCGVILSIFNNMISDIKADNNRISNENTINKSKLDAIESNVKERIPSLWQAIQRLNETSRDRTVQIDVMNSKISGLESQIKTLSEENKQLNNQVSSMRERLAALEKR